MRTMNLFALVLLAIVLLLALILGMNYALVFVNPAYSKSFETLSTLVTGGIIGIVSPDLLMNLLPRRDP
jgi:predicted exporter